MPDYHLLCVDAPDIASSAQPGQFITINCGPDLILRRPLSIHRVDNSNQLSILFAVVGRGTQWLSQRQKGEKLDLLGPLGNGFHIDQASRNLLLVAGGLASALMLGIIWLVGITNSVNLLDHADGLRDFMEENKGKLKFKPRIAE